MDPFLRPRLPHRRSSVLLLLASALVAACGSVGGSPSAPSLSPTNGSQATSVSASGSRSTPSPEAALVSRDPSIATPTAAPDLSIAAPSSAAVASPSDGPSSQAPGPRASPAPFAIDLYRRGDFVSQARSDWCVPASIQMMARLVDRSSARSLPGQRILNRRARSLSSSRLVGAGSEPQGWAGVLNRLGAGPYEVVAFRTRSAALAAAARALRSTRRPVGLLMWHGAHAWVMSGFTATADPAVRAAFRVTSIRVSDPWYPRPTSAFGRTRRPDARLSVAQLARGFLRWHRPLARYAELDGRFVVILPVGGIQSGG